MLRLHLEHARRIRLFDEARFAVPQGAVSEVGRRATRAVVMETRIHRMADPPTLEQCHQLAKGRLCTSPVALTEALSVEELREKPQKIS